MIRVRIEEAKEGMTLARPVEDGAGGVLARSGTVLSQATILQFTELGIEEMFVLPPPLTEAEREVKLKEVEGRCRRMFAGTEADPLMQDFARATFDVLRKKV